MNKRKTQEPNFDFKVLLMVHKKRAKVTSIQLAKALNISTQTLSVLTVHLDECRLCDLLTMAEVLQVDPITFINDIRVRSEVGDPSL